MIYGENESDNSVLKRLGIAKLNEGSLGQKKFKIRTGD